MITFKKVVGSISRGFLILVFTGISFRALSQDCIQNLESANRAYYNGQFEKIEQLLAGCIETGFDKLQKTEALKLLVNSFLILRDDEAAGKYLYRLLKTEPEYDLQSNDIPEFRKMYETYRIRTRFTFGITTGVLLPDYQILHYRSYASETVEPVDYNENSGLTTGLSGDVAIYGGFFLNGSLIYQSSSFSQQEIILNYQSVGSKEKEFRLSFPLQIRYIYDKWKFRPFLGGGLSLHYLIKAKADIDHIPITPEYPIPFIGVPVSVKNFDLTSQKTRVTWNTLFSGGVQWKAKSFLIEFRFTYERGLNNLINTAKRYSNQVLLDNFAYVPDDVKMDNYLFTVSLLRNFTWPIKK